MADEQAYLQDIAAVIWRGSASFSDRDPVSGKDLCNAEKRGNRSFYDKRKEGKE